MTYDEPLVGSLAIMLALVATAIAVGPWSGPYELRTFSAIGRRFGKPVARTVWVAIAITALAVGISVFTGFRPDFVNQDRSVEQ